MLNFAYETAKNDTDNIPNVYDLPVKAKIFLSKNEQYFQEGEKLQMIDETNYTNLSDSV